VSEQEGIDLVAMFFEEARKYSPLDNEEELRLAREMRNGNKEEKKKARELLIKHNLRLAISIAKRYRGRGMEFLDLIQESIVGLVVAVDKYDPERGNRLSTLIVPWCRQAVSRSVENYGRLIRVPAYVGQIVYQIRLTTDLLTQELGREPTPDEIALKMDLPFEKVEQYLEVARLPKSLDAPLDQRDDLALVDLVPDKRLENRPDDAVDLQGLRQDLLNICDSLDEKERQVIVSYFGLETGEKRSLRSVGKELGLTHQRIFQIRASALRKLRAPIRSRRLLPYLD